MYGNNAYSLYQQNSVSVESPVKLVEMLYEGILRFCAQAKRHMEAEDIEKIVEYSGLTEAEIEEVSKEMLVEMNNAG